MKATFNLTPADFKLLMALLMQKTKRNAPYRPLWFTGEVFIWMLIGAGISVFVKIYQHAEDLKPGLLLVASVFAAALILRIIYFAALRKMYLRRAISPKGAFLSTQTIEANTEGLLIENDQGKSFTRWAGFLSLAEDKSNLYLFVDSLEAIVLPKTIPCIAELTKLVKENISA
ncbi:MAG: YcxB family protein [Pseudomonadota bacterium]